MIPICHRSPAVHAVEAEIIAASNSRIRLSADPLYPGGGGQPADRGSAAAYRPPATETIIPVAQGRSCTNNQTGPVRQGCSHTCWPAR